MSIAWEAVNIYNHTSKYTRPNPIHYLNKRYPLTTTHVKWIYYIRFVYVENICVQHIHFNIYNLHMCNMKIIHICSAYNWSANKIELVLIIIMCMIIWKQNCAEYLESSGDFRLGQVRINTQSSEILVR